MSDFDIEPMYGKFPQMGNHAIEDFEESFMKYISHEKQSPFYQGFIIKFGDIKFGEIDNPRLNSFGEFIIQ